VPATLDFIHTDPPVAGGWRRDSRLALPADATTPRTPAAVRALIVDDDKDLRDSLRFLLEMEGYEVDEARDGLEALDILRASLHPLVVLLDVVMPRMNGIEVLRTVAGEPRLAARHTFLMVTANEDRLQPASDHLLRQLAVPVVAKPFDLDRLLDVVAASAQRLGEGPAQNAGD
jgi:CheY-like chemotaxis protein